MISAALKTKNRVLLTDCKIARDFFSRFMGLMGRTSLSGDEGILFPQCNSIHTLFMRMRIDVVLIDRMGAVVGVVENLAPWRLLLPKKNTKHVLELKAFRSRELGIVPGTQLEIPGVWA